MRMHRLCETVLPYVSNRSDDFSPHRFSIAVLDAQAFADRILARPIGTGQCFSDDRHGGRILIIRPRERATVNRGIFIAAKYSGVILGCSANTTESPG